LRYKDADFNLDLSYITRRVIAMGYPGSGLNGLVRNHIGDVVLYFQKYHDLKIKIYNMCNDKFVDPSVIQMTPPGLNRTLRLAYFPMMDHNPGPVPIILKFTIDAVLYLAADPENTIAVHCKAGKGRTGLAICAYFILTEQVSSAVDAVKLFNSRRTTNGKGLGIASQIRYLDYFH
jgi:phosphatidylinositol-3,4,5-trisphosphate 3-phosphatase/dual-specificity protein phosphatase PTEN